MFRLPITITRAQADDFNRDIRRWEGRGPRICTAIRLSGQPVRLQHHRTGEVVPIYPGIDPRVAKVLANDKRRRRAGRWYSGKKP